MESRIEILDRLAVKHRTTDVVESFEDMLNFEDNFRVIIIVRLAMDEYSKQEREFLKKKGE